MGKPQHDDTYVPPSRTGGPGVVPGERGPEALSSGGMPGGVGDTNINAGALCAPARPRHRGDAGGGQPPPTTVPPRCDLQLSRKALNGRHLGTIQCRTRMEQKRRQLDSPQVAPIERLPG